MRLTLTRKQDNVLSLQPKAAAVDALVVEDDDPITVFLYALKAIESMPQRLSAAAFSFADKEIKKRLLKKTGSSIGA